MEILLEVCRFDRCTDRSMIKELEGENTLPSFDQLSSSGSSPLRLYGVDRGISSGSLPLCEGIHFSR